jgi:(2Fe-2S) ferredoxin
LTYYTHHIFFCLNERDDGAQCCSDFGAASIFVYMKKKIKTMNLRGQGKVRVNRGGCFDRCHEGPLMVIYPEAVWYRYIDENDIDEIISEHILNNRVVKRLLA